jgi:anaerobic selenocysteine-containing dehydrogenase
MDRRNFLKISAVTGATTALDSCGNPERQLIRFIPEEDLVPGIAQWKPSVCTLCPAGCGLTVRVMEGDAEVIRQGRLGLMKMGLAKKLEGNPHHPTNQGRLCARGQAGVQVTYHPDRLRNPLKRSGPRASGQYQEVGWDTAIHEVVTQLETLRSSNQASSLAFLARPLRGQRRALIEQFLSTYGAPPPFYFELFDHAVERWANLSSFGRPQLPTFDLARANYVLSLGADFLGTWNSPVAQAIGYGAMRQGRPGARAKFVQVEPRMSQTGASADEWIPARPGSEGVLALGLAHVILQEKLLLAPANSRATELIAGWKEGLPGYSPKEVEAKTGVTAEKVERLARELAGHLPAVAMIGGAPLAHTNSAFNALAVNALNALLGSIEAPGGILFAPGLPTSAPAAASTATTPQGSYAQLIAFVQQIVIGSRAPKALLLYDANPVYAAPGSANIRAGLERVPFIASFGSFIDETSALADLILPDHSPLESWHDHVPESGTGQAAVSLAPPAVIPLHSTRSTPDVLLEIAHQLGADMAKALPHENFEGMLKSAYADLQKFLGSVSGAESPDDFWSKLQEQGGWWSAEVKSAPPLSPAGSQPPTAYAEPQFDGSENEYPFHFLPFESQMLYDGSLAHLPWMQEAPDVLSTVMWSSWVEINPQTAARLSIRQGDLLEVTSQHGTLRAPAVISPGIAPDVIAMPVGQGHEQFTRYASGRGANAVAILAPKTEPETGALAWAATRVRISREGEGRVALFGGGMSEFPHERR